MYELKFIETDAEALAANVLTELQRLTGEAMYPGDERVIHAKALVTILVALFNTVNEKCKARMLRYASGTVLDALGEFRRCTRLPAKSATTTEQFTIAVARGTSVPIPAGSRISDGNTIFRTIEAAAIPAGQLTVDVAIESVEGGASKNGIPIGAISTLIDAVPYITGVTNTAVTTGGDDGEPYPEDDGGAGDERYRDRIRISNSAYTTAGAEDSYVYWAKTANATIEDVKVLSEQAAGTVDIYVTTKGGALPSQDVLDDTYAVLSARAKRPMNDKVNVHAPTVVSYDIEIGYTVRDGDQVRALADISGANGGVTKFIAWQKAKIGRDINPDRLKRLVMTPSDGSSEGAVYACEIIKPLPTVIAANELAVWSGNVVIHDPTILFDDD